MLAVNDLPSAKANRPQLSLKIVASSPSKSGTVPGSENISWSSLLGSNLPARHLPTVLKPGENLFLQGDVVEHVYILKEGWAFRYQCLEDGRRQIVDFLLPGDVLGLGESQSMSCGVEALTKATFVRFQRGEFMGLLRDRPELTHKLMDVLWATQERAFEHVTSVGRRTARERVAHLLLELVGRVRKSGARERHASLNLPLMQPHIGDALGLASETVCRCLSHLRKNGIVVLRSGHLEVLDIARLAEEGGVYLEDAGEGGDYPCLSARL